MLTLGLSPRLQRSLATTNAAESLMIRHVKRNVKRWRGGQMMLRGVAVGRAARTRFSLPACIGPWPAPTPSSPCGAASSAAASRISGSDVPQMPRECNLTNLTCTPAPQSATRPAGGAPSRSKAPGASAAWRAHDWTSGAPSMGQRIEPERLAPYFLPGFPRSVAVPDSWHETCVSPASSSGCVPRPHGP